MYDVASMMWLAFKTSIKKLLSPPSQINLARRQSIKPFWLNRAHAMFKLVHEATTRDGYMYVFISNSALQWQQNVNIAVRENCVLNSINYILRRPELSISASGPNGH